MLFTFAFDINEDVIEVHYHKNVKFLCHDLIDVALKRDRCVSQSKRYNLVLEVAITSLEGRFPFITFPNPYLIVGIGQIELSETFSPT